MRDRLVAVAAISAAVAIGAGAFGAHGAGEGAAELLRTGGWYQLVHAVAVVVVARAYPGPARALLAGSLVFSLSLYALAAGAPRWTGAVTPFGGMLMIAGWLWLAYRASSSRNAATSSSDTDLST